MNERRIFAKALDTYGVMSQILMTFEEMSELQKALCKFFRGEHDIVENSAAIAEEIADVEIMLTQMKQLFVLEDAVDYARQFKVARLAERLGMED